MKERTVIFNGAENWRANPWVWVIEFKQVIAREVERG